MHSCCLVFTNEFPTDDVLAKALEPFNEEDFYEKNREIENPVYPEVMWDWWQVGGRYGGRLILREDKSREEYEWPYLARENRAGRLFRSSCIEKTIGYAEKCGEGWRIREEEMFAYMETDDDHIRIDGGEISLIENADDLPGCCMISTDGSAHSRAHWDGHKWAEHADYETAVHKAVKESKFVCVVDLHN